MSDMNTDFTVDAYRRLIGAASARFHFARFGAPFPSGDVALWRHDIDFSPQRALSLARLEAEYGVVATYFVQISSRYYNVFEPEVGEVIRSLVKLGHGIGLHFDAEVCRHTPSPNYEQRLLFEAGALEEIAEANVTSFSLHNPTTLIGVAFDEGEYGTLKNASCSALRSEFSYCSDSNGIWRYRTLPEMVADSSVRRLYALTHPEWWQDVPLQPRQRLQRCIDGRARFCASYYDGLLAENDRPNVGMAE